MKWYTDQRRHIEGEIKKYKDPPSEALLPDLPSQARYRPPTHIPFIILNIQSYCPGV